MSDEISSVNELRQAELETAPEDIRRSPISDTELKLELWKVQSAFTPFTQQEVERAKRQIAANGRISRKRSEPPGKTVWREVTRRIGDERLMTAVGSGISVKSHRHLLGS